MKKLFIFLFVICLTLYVQAQYKVGDIYNKNGVIGMVVDVDESGNHGLLLSLTESKEDWTTEKKIKVHIGTSNEDNGEMNMQVLENYISNNHKDWSDFPVFEWVRSLGKGWYLPAKNELISIWINLNGGDLKLNKKSKKIWKQHNKAMKKAGGDALFTRLSIMESGINHVLMGMISSTESNNDNIWAVNVVGSRCISDALAAPNATIEATELEKNNHSETKNIITARRKFASRAVYRF